MKQDYLICPDCGAHMPLGTKYCPSCGNQMFEKEFVPKKKFKKYRGWEWKSKISILGLPLVHIAFGKNKWTGKLLVATGIIAIGQFAVGVISICQFGIGLLFGLGQFVAGFVSIAQFALGIYFGLGQFASGYTVIGQFAIGVYVLAQNGYGFHLWTKSIQDPLAIEHFNNLYATLQVYLAQISSFFSRSRE